MTKMGIFHVTRVSAALIVAGVMAFAAKPAHALLEFDISDGATTTAFAEGGALDESLDPGRIEFNDSIGVFNIVLATGLSKPIIGSETEAVLDLLSLSLSSTAGGSLTIKMTDTDFTQANYMGFMTTNIGGTSTGSVNIKTYIDSTNTAFGTETLLADLDVADFSSSGIAAFAGHKSGWINTGAPYSLTMIVTVSHDNAGDLTSFDAELRVLPEPAALALFGIGLTGLGLISRRRGARR